MDYVSLIYAQFLALAPERKLRKLSENSRPDGAIVECAIDELIWADCYYLFLFWEGKNFSEVPTEVLKPPRPLNWLLENLDAVYLLMGDAIRKKVFLSFKRVSVKKDRKEKCLPSRESAESCSLSGSAFITVTVLGCTP